MPNTGLLVALWLTNTGAVLDGMPVLAGDSIDVTPEDGYHITVGWFGDASAYSQAILDRFLGAVKDVATVLQPFEVTISGVGRFSASSSSDGKDVIIALVDSPDLEKLRREVVDAAAASGIDNLSEHGYSPHMTLAYIPTDVRAVFDHYPAFSVGFDKVSVKVGDVSYEYPMASGTVEKTFSPVAKVSESQQLVFGWANISVRADGEQILDLQSDLINPSDLEKAAYEFVLNFRETGVDHEGIAKGRLVESLYLDHDKAVSMGLPGIPEGMPTSAWWIGFKIDDQEVFEKVVDGTYSMFSIQGRAIREDVK